MPPSELTACVGEAPVTPAPTVADQTILPLARSSPVTVPSSAPTRTIPLAMSSGEVSSRPRSTSHRWRPAASCAQTPRSERMATTLPSTAGAVGDENPPADAPVARSKAHPGPAGASGHTQRRPAPTTVRTPAPLEPPGWFHRSVPLAAEKLAEAV
jgi:hypothetical protein